MTCMVPSIPDAEQLIQVSPGPVKGQEGIRHYGWHLFGYAQFVLQDSTNSTGHSVLLLCCSDATHLLYELMSLEVC